MLDDSNVMYYPGAFSQASRATLAELFPDAVIATEADALAMGLNAVSDGMHVVIASEATELADQLREHGYLPVPVDLSELVKGGGNVKCCTLELLAGADQRSRSVGGGNRRAGCLVDRTMTEILRYAAFTDVPNGGNPAGVVPDATGLDEAAMLAIAAEVGYSESDTWLCCCSTTYCYPRSSPTAPKPFPRLCSPPRPSRRCRRRPARRRRSGCGPRSRRRLAPTAGGPRPTHRRPAACGRRRLP